MGMGGGGGAMNMHHHNVHTGNAAYNNVPQPQPQPQGRYGGDDDAIPRQEMNNLIDALQRANFDEDRYSVISRYASSYFFT